MLGVVNKKAPVAMIRRPTPRKDGGDAGGTIAEDRFKPTAMRGHFLAKALISDDLPAARVHEDEERQCRLHRSFVGRDRGGLSQESLLSEGEGGCFTSFSTGHLYRLALRGDNLQQQMHPCQLQDLLHRQIRGKHPHRTSMH